MQCMHCVMHKCIMVKVGGDEKHRKCKTRKFDETRGKFAKIGGDNNFSEIGGKCTEAAKIGGKLQICSR